MSLIFELTRDLISDAAPSPIQPRYAPFFDGVTQYGVLAQRAINVDEDIDIEFYTPASVGAGNKKTIVGQSVSAIQGEKEFELFISDFTGNLGCTVGGNTFAIADDGTFSAGVKYKWTLQGAVSRLTELSTGKLIVQRNFTRGAAREPLAKTTICARGGTPASYFDGLEYDLKIGNTTWPMNQRNNPVQSSIPAGNDMTIINHTDAMWRQI